MLTEISMTMQRSGEPRRRWFTDERMDLVTWSQTTEIVAFQLTYDKPHDEKVLSWKKESGFLHGGIDDGDRPGKHKGTPIVVTDGVFESRRILEEFESRALEIDSAIAAFVSDRIERSGL